MAGPKTKIDYISDDGVTYVRSVPSWQAAFTGDAAATSSVAMPKGMHPRRRMLRGDTTGREYKVTVGDVTLSAYTTNNSAAVAVPPTIPGAPDSAFTFGGRIGERDLIRS